jgi:hypothetical protein
MVRSSMSMLSESGLVQARPDTQWLKASNKRSKPASEEEQEGRE